MQYCKRCVMPSTRPGITFDSEGICSACRAHEKKATVDWEQRYKELETLCDKYRGMNGDGYDCMIAVSGGKDSHWQVHVMKDLMKMNPILVSVEDNFPMTKAGEHNIKNISEEFGCHIISLKPDIKAQKTIMRYTFEKYGKPTWYVDRLIYTYPLRMAVLFNTPLLVYGENVSLEYGGADAKETYSAREIMENGVASDISFEELCALPGIDEKTLSFFNPPSKEEMQKIEGMSFDQRMKFYKEKYGTELKSKASTVNGRYSMPSKKSYANKKKNNVAVAKQNKTQPKKGLKNMSFLDKVKAFFGR